MMRFSKTTIKYNFLFVFFFLLFFANTYAQYVFKNNELPKKISLHQYVAVADVGQRDLDIEFIKKHFASLNAKQLKTESDDLGFTQNNFWAKLELQNTTESNLRYYLETARPITDLVELYIVDAASGQITKLVSGDKMPYHERTFDNHKTIFKINIKSKSQLTLFLHLKSDGEVVKMPVLLYDADQFIETATDEQMFFGIFFGVLMITAIIYFFFFIGLRDSTFLYYTLYVVFVGLLQFALDGYFYKYITPSGGWFSNHAVLFIAILAVLLSGKYSEVFLKIKIHSKRIYFLFNVAYVLLIVLFLCIIFIPAVLIYCYVLVNVFTLMYLFLIVFTISYLYYKKKPVDTLFSIGIFFLILGFIVFILHNFGLVASNFFTQNSSKLGTGLEVIFLSLSMSNLIRNLKNEKNELNRIALARSEEMNDLKSYFLSNISHELRTPLNAITNLIDSISNEVKDKKVIKNCKIIKYSSHSLLSSVNDILDFSKIEKGELQLEKAPFDLLKMVKSIKKNAQRRAKDKELDFQFTKSGTFPDLLIGDENRLSQIINNVLSNAIKFTSKGYVKFDVEMQIKENHQADLILTVSDSGVGILKDKMDRIFDSFSQNKIDNKRKFGGLGLGLYIVKTLVDMQNGIVDMQSTVGVGTICKITLTFDVIERPEAKIIAAESEVYDLGGKTILVVEDNSINQMVIKMITKKWLNTSVLYANNGQEGVDALKSNAIDIVLMDLQMPVMDGYEATIAIRNGEAGSQNTNIPIIAVTADVMEGTKLRVVEIGMNNYLSKPIKKETLYQAIKELV